MKLHITTEQYEENKEIKQKLESIGLFNAESVRIDKLIELVDEYQPKMEKGRHWTVEIITGRIPSNFIEKQKQELCDALWEAWKETIQ